ncbi:MAG: hypothetical protein QCI38_03065, partial [Candidatus Thermoplasmatota archaeon]|nr:hypothetical protein [Candidatus Thermoplasmatota archaeon]
MKQRKTVRRQLLSLMLISLFIIPLLPLAGSDTPPGTPYYVYGFVEDENGPVVGAVVNLTLSTGGTVVAWNETTTDTDGLYIALFQSAGVGDEIAGRVASITNNLLVDNGPGGWLNFTYTHLEYTLSPGWNLISMGLLTSTLAS